MNVTLACFFLQVAFDLLFNCVVISKLWEMMSQMTISKQVEALLKPSKLADEVRATTCALRL